MSDKPNQQAKHQKPEVGKVICRYRSEETVWEGTQRECVVRITRMHHAWYAYNSLSGYFSMLWETLHNHFFENLPAVKGSVRISLFHVHFADSLETLV